MPPDVPRSGVAAPVLRSTQHIRTESEARLSVRYRWGESVRPPSGTANHSLKSTQYSNACQRLIGGAITNMP